MQEELFKECLAVVPTGRVLLEAGFVFDSKDGDQLLFIGGPAGRALRITAGQDMFQTHWQLLATMNSERSALCEEFFFLKNDVRGNVLKRLWEVWDSAYKNVPPPPAFDVGREFKEYEAVKKAMDPGPPSLSVDGEMLRMVIRRYRDKLIPKEPTGGLRLSYADRQLRLTSTEDTFYCPAWGHWFGEAEVDVISFVGLAPRAFHRGRASIRFFDELLWLEGVCMPGVWRNEAPAADAGGQSKPPVKATAQTESLPIEKFHAISMCPCLQTNTRIPTTNHQNLGYDDQDRNVSTYQCTWCETDWLRVGYRNDSFSRSHRYYRVPIRKSVLDTLNAENAVWAIEQANFRIVGGELYRFRERCEFGPGGNVDLYS